MRRTMIATAGAMMCAAALTAAQATQPGQQSTTPRPQGAQEDTRTANQQGNTTLTGCVYRERDVPGRTPNIAERAGILEDYIFAAVGMAAGPSGSATGATGTAGSNPTGSSTTGTAGRAGTPAMYKLERVDDDRLRALVGKRVEVTGRIDAEPGDQGASRGGASGTAPGAGTSQGAGATSPGASSPGRGAQGAGSQSGGSQGAGATPSAGSDQGTRSSGSQADKSIGPDRIELPEFEVTSIREVSGTCPSTPTAQ